MTLFGFLTKLAYVIDARTGARVITRPYPTLRDAQAAANRMNRELGIVRFAAVVR